MGKGKGKWNRAMAFLDWGGFQQHCIASNAFLLQPVCSVQIGSLLIYAYTYIYLNNTPLDEITSAMQSVQSNLAKVFIHYLLIIVIGVLLSFITLESRESLKPLKSLESLSIPNIEMPYLFNEALSSRSNLTYSPTKKRKHS